MYKAISNTKNTIATLSIIIFIAYPTFFNRTTFNCEALFCIFGWELQKTNYQNCLFRKFPKVLMMLTALCIFIHSNLIHSFSYSNFIDLFCIELNQNDIFHFNNQKNNFFSAFKSHQPISHFVYWHNEINSKLKSMESLCFRKLLHISHSLSLQFFFFNYVSLF